MGQADLGRVEKGQGAAEWRGLTRRADHGKAGMAGGMGRDMITRFKFTHKYSGGDEEWFVYRVPGGRDINICPGELDEYVDGIGNSKTIYLCFSDKPHPEKYAYQYYFKERRYGYALFLRIEGQENETPFLHRVDKLFWDAAENGLIPETGWGWIEYE